MRRFFKVIGVIAIVLAVAAALLAGIGMALPASHEATRSARINATPDAIYPILIAPEAYGEWRPDVERVDRMDADRFREHGAHGAIVFRITERHPPSRLVVTVDDADQPFTGAWTIDLQPDGASTRVRITERGAVPNPLFRALSRAFISPTESLEAYLKNLGRRFGHDAVIEP